MSRASILSDSHLLDWSTALVGFQRGSMTAAEVAELAVAKIGAEAGPIGRDLAEVASAEALMVADVVDHLTTLSESSAAVDDELAVRRWLLASLIELEQSRLDEEAVLARLQRIYAEFGYPEELRYVTPYNLTPGDWALDPQIGRSTSSQVETFHRVLRDLRATLSNER